MTREHVFFFFWNFLFPIYVKDDKGMRENWYEKVMHQLISRMVKTSMYVIDQTTEMLIIVGAWPKC